MNSGFSTEEPGYDSDNAERRDTKNANANGNGPAYRGEKTASAMDAQRRLGQFLAFMVMIIIAGLGVVLILYLAGRCYVIYFNIPTLSQSGSQTKESQITLCRF